MTSDDTILLEVTTDALSGGHTVIPQALLAAVGSAVDPVQALSGHDDSVDLFEALDKEFPFIRIAHVTQRRPQDDEVAQWSGLLRWVFDGFRLWRTANDPDCRTLVALFAAMQSFRGGAAFWAALPDELGENIELNEALEKKIASLRVTLSLAGRPAGISEREAIERFSSADRNGDWMAIMDQWPLFENVLLFDCFQGQAAQWLYRFDLGRLVSSVRDCRETPAAMVVANALTAAQRFRVAARCDNARIQFACIYQAFSARLRKATLDKTDEGFLIEALVKVANEPPRWAAWMRMFNRYPLRYPALQTALGAALAAAPDTAMKEYVGSIDLRASRPGSDTSRKCVAACLRAFRDVAADERRRALWTFAHERWSEWKFDSADKNANVIDISWCELDYAVMGYALECMDQTARNATIASIHGMMSRIDNDWHESLSNFVTAFNRLQSSLQPYVHANHIAGSSAEWLSEKTMYQAYDASNNYSRMMFELPSRA